MMNFSENRVIVIAEAGVNHNGSLEIAKKMVDAAVKAGADIIKFQTFVGEKVISRYAPKAKYQLETTAEGESQLDMVKKLEFSPSEHKELFNYCIQKNIQYLSSPFDLESIELLAEMNVKAIKIPSGEITNLPYLRKIGALQKTIILSTGMSTLGEIETAIDILTRAGTKRENIVLLHCTTEYPAPYEEVNLQAILTLQKAFGLKTGLSDHTEGIEIAIAAAAMGASVIEKHFTLDKNMEGPDHKASLSPEELYQMIRTIRHVEKAMGNGIKKPSPSETANIPIVRKSIVAARPIARGEVFSPENITTKRPGTGISPMHWDYVIGKKAPRDFKEDELIEL